MWLCLCFCVFCVCPFVSVFVCVLCVYVLSTVCLFVDGFCLCDYLSVEIFVCGSVCVRVSFPLTIFGCLTLYVSLCVALSWFWLSPCVSLYMCISPRVSMCVIVCFSV